MITSIEQEIGQQKPFNNIHEKVLVNLIYTSLWMKQLQTDYFKNFDLTDKQYNILRILRGAKAPISTALIRERMLDKASDASRIVDRLAKKNLVKKEKCVTDTRKVDITLSNAGQKLLKEIDKTIGNWTNKYSGLTKKEAQLLSDLLDKMRKN